MIRKGCLVLSAAFLLAVIAIPLHAYLCGLRLEGQKAELESLIANLPKSATVDDLQEELVDTYGRPGLVVEEMPGHTVYFYGDRYAYWLGIFSSNAAMECSFDADGQLSDSEVEIQTYAL